MLVLCLARGGVGFRVVTTLPEDTGLRHSLSWFTSCRVMESGPTEGWLLWEQVLMLQSLLKQAQGQMAQQVQVQTEAGVQRGILQESQKLLQWAESIQAQLCSKEELEDVASAQQLLRKHGALQEETCLWRERLGQA